MDGLILNLVRPFRFRYSIFDLGTKLNDQYEREDSSILNDRGLRLHYSYYRNKKPSTTCMVYAHCNSGCRVEGLQFIQPVIEQGWNLCLFDFTGSGISEGEYVSMGYYQSMDLQAVVSVVLKEGNSCVSLWGRSMGAATIILYLAQTKQIQAISCCVLDSPYSSLWNVIRELGKSKTKMPEFILEHIMEYIRRSILKDHQFDIKELELLKKINKIEVPIMLVASTADSFVHYSHAAQLYKEAASQIKVLEYIDKEHNSPREMHTIALGISFMANNIIRKQINKRELHKQSKKKELCRKMTGRNMAELITKPATKPSTKQSINIHPYSKLTSFCATKSSKTKQQREDKSSINEKCLKNPHTIQQSIIKLTVPSKSILELAKLSKPDLLSLEEANIFEHQTSTKPETIQELADRIDKQNQPLNCSIKNFSTIINKRLPFENEHMHSTLKLQNSTLKLESKDIKNKTQKISIHLKHVVPALQKKVSGIKITHKNKMMSFHQDKMFDKATSLKQSLQDEQTMPRIRDRIKTELSHNVTHLNSTNSDEQMDWHDGDKDKQSPLKYMDHIRIHTNWSCGTELCLPKNKFNLTDENVDQNSRKSIKNHNKFVQEKSFDQYIEDQKVDDQTFHNTHHFHSTEAVPSLKKRAQNFERVAGRVIRVQLDPRLLNKIDKQQYDKNNKVDQLCIDVSIPKIQLNPTLSKLKPRQRKSTKINLHSSQNRSFL